MPDNLFTTTTIEDDFKKRRRRASESVAAMTSIDDLGANGQRLYESLRVDFPKLDRNTATWDHKPTNRGVEVALTVPYTGSMSAFGFIPPGEDRYRFDGVSGKFYGGYRDAQSSLVLTNTFNEPTEAEVRAWGKDTVDRIAQILAALEPHVASENRQLMDLIGLGLNKRKQTLDAGKGLGDLGTGV